MSNVQSNLLLQVETTCGTLLHELQIIWDEIGEPEAERDKTVLEIEQECLEVYRKKVDQANRCRAQLRQVIADSEAELATICSVMGERPVYIRKSDQTSGSLKDELRAILPQVEEMRKRICDRRNQFTEVLEFIQNISNEIHRSSELTTSRIVVDETDLSAKKLEELHRELEALQKEKSERMIHLLDLVKTLNSLCLVLGIDFKQTVNEVHSSLSNDSEGTKNISNDTIEKLGSAIQGLKEVKMQRMQRLQDLATSMLELWNLMDTPIEEQQMFQNVTCNIAASEHELTETNMLSEDFINSVAAEVFRLEELKASKMKELVLRKRSELEEICRKTHLIPESDNAVEVAMEAIESGALDPAAGLEEIELQIGRAKEEAFSRREILEKVEKWLAACEEECWLEEYNMDENRYNAGRGTHLNLKRAEKARALVNKLPGMVEGLASKTTSWESERGVKFIYDGIRLLSMLEEYTILQQEKEQERKRRRDQKKLQGQLMTEQEALFGSKPNSPMKLQSGKKASKLSSGGGSFKRLSVGTVMQTPKADILQTIKATPSTRQAKKNDPMHPNDQLNQPQNDVFAAASNGNAREVVESPMQRKPFLPIFTTKSSKFEDTTNLIEDTNRFQNEMLQKTDCGINVQFTTPTKTTSPTEEENTPRKAMTIPIPSTPPTVSAPMQTAMTPAPIFVHKPVEAIPEEVEYSFEERRAGFMLVKTHSEMKI